MLENAYAYPAAIVLITAAICFAFTGFAAYVEARRTRVKLAFKQRLIDQLRVIIRETGAVHHSKHCQARELRAALREMMHLVDAAEADQEGSAFMHTYVIRDIAARAIAAYDCAAPDVAKMTAPGAVNQGEG